MHGLLALGNFHFPVSSHCCCPIAVVAPSATPSVLSGMSKIQRWLQSKLLYLLFITFFVSIYSVFGERKGGIRNKHPFGHEAIFPEKSSPTGCLSVDSEPSFLASCLSFSIYWLLEFPMSTFIIQHHCEPFYLTLPFLCCHSACISSTSGR